MAEFEPDYLSEPTSRLEKPIQLKDFIDGCSDFTIRSMSEDEIEKAEIMDISQVYTPEELEPYCLTDVLEPPSDNEDDDLNCDNITKSFPVFRKKMCNVTEDGKVMKLIEKHGSGKSIPPEEKMVVYIHYASYVEFAENPFDCSRLRQKKPERKKLGVGELIPGLEIAIRSMLKGEKAKFLVHPDLAYREKGIPPRIPPQATILYDVDLIDLCEYADIEQLDRKERTFDQSLEIATKLRKRGTKLKTLEKNLNGAISAYNKGLQILLEASFSSDEQDTIRKQEMLKFYTNLAVCYWEKKHYRKVCTMYNDARMDCGGLAETHVKLLFNSAKALRMLASYDEAMMRLQRARKYCRNAEKIESIVKELAEVSDAWEKNKENEKRMCKKMFGFLNLNDESKIDDLDEALENVETDFREVIYKTLETFEISNKKSERFNDCVFTHAEREFIKKTCQKRNLTFKSFPDNSFAIIKREI